MKKTLFIIALLIGIGNLNAQSDATWGETIKFIEKYSHYLHVTACVNDDCCEDLNDFNISGSKISFTNLKGEGEGNESKQFLNLSKLTSSKISKDKTVLHLSFTGNYWTIDYLGGKYNRKEDSGYFYICDKEILNRMHKAFSHLAKLATEKREAERKASGDKF